MFTCIRVIGKITHVEVIAVGRSIRNRSRLENSYGKGRWRKLKGIGTAVLADNTLCRGEIHWYEAHGIGKFEFKMKRPLGD